MSEQIRVTEVLDYFKEEWYVDWVLRVGKRERNRISKEALAIGSKVDGYIKSDPYGQVFMPKERPEVEMAMAGYRRWLGVYRPSEIVPAERLYRTFDGVTVTGEPDLYVDGTIVDIKCASKISLKYWIQVMMYQFLIGIRGGKVGVLRLDKITGSYEYVIKDFDERLVEVWVGMMRAMMYLRGEVEDGA